MLSSKKVKLDFESNKKLENLNSIAVNLFSNPGLNKTKKFNEAKNFVLELTKCLGIEPNSRQPFSFILNSKFRKNAGWFEDHPVMADSKAGEYIKHDNKCPIDINIFWLNKLVNSRIKGAVHFSANYEDSKLTREESDKHIGIDTFLHPDLRGITIALSDNGNVRVLELRGALNVTQKQILSNWIVLGNNLIENEESKSNRKYIHESLWDSFELKMVNKVFYEMIASAFNELSSFLVDHKIFDEASAKNFSNRLISRILFIWFLRKKEFIFTEKIDYFNVDNLDDKDYYYQKLTKLFFNVLNTPWEDRDKKNDDLKTPYLNGGLFKRNKEDIDKIDFPKGFFCRLYQNLNEYNFTVDESSVDFQQVAIDPEMLGKVFENLLASMADENGEQARKAKGSFYTPREIVTYMCRESLREYLFSKITSESDRNIINELIDTPDHSWEIDKSNSTRDISKKSKSLYVNIMNALRDVKVLDPACGSGAYPISMMYELLRLNLRLDRRLDEYRTKFEIFKNNIYGVDIDPIAIEISRLRSFLSLVVDQEYNDKKINGGIESLPNLEFKFVCANTLVELSAEEGLYDGISWDNLNSIKSKYFNANVSLREKLEKEWQKISNIALFESDRALQLKSYKPFVASNSALFYDPKLMHDVEDNFDIVIGNPPYISALVASKIIDKKTRNFYKNKYISAKGTYDIYLLFFEKGLSLLKKNGSLVYITPTKYLSANYASSFRKDVALTKVKTLVDFSQYRVFESAGVSTFVSIFSNEEATQDVITYIFDQSLDFSKPKIISNSRESLTFFPEFLWGHLISGNYDLLNKIYNNSKAFESTFAINSSSTAGEADEYVKYISDVNIGKKIINTGTISPYRSLWGEKEYSNKKEKIMKPYLDLNIASERRKKMYDSKKVIFPKLSKRLYAVIDAKGEFASTNTTFIYGLSDTSVKVIGALVNSSLYDFIYKSIFSGLNLLGSFQFQAPQIRLLPYKEVTDCTLKTMVVIVDQILMLKNQNKDADTKNLESQIDQLVYKLYDLTPEEIEIVENSLK